MGAPAILPCLTRKSAAAKCARCKWLWNEGSQRLLMQHAGFMRWNHLTGDESCVRRVQEPHEESFSMPSAQLGYLIPAPTHLLHHKPAYYLRTSLATTATEFSRRSALFMLGDFMCEGRRSHNLLQPAVVSICAAPCIHDFQRACITHFT